MANYATLKAAIQSVIKQNGNNEITGALLQQSLLSMINSLGAYYQFAGLATPSTNPGTPDQNVCYLASTAGTYSNFGGIVLNSGEVAILAYNGSWTKYLMGAASLEQLNNLEIKLKERANALVVPIFKGDVVAGYYNESGNISSSSASVLEDSYIPVYPGEKLHMNFTTQYRYKVVFYDVNKAIISVRDWTTTNMFVTPTGCTFIRLCFNVAGGVNPTNFQPVFISEIPSSVGLDNTHVLTPDGWNDDFLKIGDVSLPVLATGYTKVLGTITETGYIDYGSNTRVITSWIPAASCTKITLALNNWQVRVAFFDANYKYLGRTDDGRGGIEPEQFPGTTYIRVLISKVSLATIDPSEISSIGEQIYINAGPQDKRYTLTDAPTFVQGGYYANGVPANRNDRIRTGLIPINTICHCGVKRGFTIAYYIFDKDRNFVSTTGVFTSAEFYNKIINGFVAFLIGRSDGQAIAPADLSETGFNIEYYPLFAEQSPDYKLIKLAAIAPSYAATSEELGVIYYNTTSKQLRHFFTFTGSAPEWEIVPFVDGAIYTYNSELYLWNGTDLINVTDAIKELITQITDVIKMSGLSISLDAFEEIGNYYIYPVTSTYNPGDLVASNSWRAYKLNIGIISINDGVLVLNSDTTGAYAIAFYSDYDTVDSTTFLDGIIFRAEVGGRYEIDSSLIPDGCKCIAICNKVSVGNASANLSISYSDILQEFNNRITELENDPAIPVGGQPGDVLTPDGWNGNYPQRSEVVTTQSLLALLNDYVKITDYVSNISNGAVTLPTLSQAVLDLINTAGGGTIVNMPDDIDIETNAQNRLQLKGGGVVRFRVQSTAADNYTELVRCINVGLPIQIENVVDLANSDGTIRNISTLDGKTLVFVGNGQIKNCRISGKIKVQAGLHQIFDNVYFHYWDVNGTALVYGETLYESKVANTNNDVYNRKTKTISAANVNTAFNPFETSLTRNKIGEFIAPVLVGGKYVYQENGTTVITFEDDGSGNVKIPIRKDFVFLNNGVVAESTYNIKTKTATYVWAAASTLRISRLYAPARVLVGGIDGSVFPEWWGAVAGSDSVAAFQWAFIHGNDIQLSQDYIISGGVRVFGNTKVSGNKRSVTLSNYSSATSMFEIESLAGVQDGIYITDLTLNGNKSNQSGIQDGIFCDFNKGLQPFDGYSVDNTYWYNLMIKSFSGSGICIAVPGTSHIYSSFLTLNGYDGITWDNEHFTLTNVTCWGNKRHGAYAGGNHWRIIGGAYAHNDAGDNIHCDGAFESQIIGCSCIDAGEFVPETGGGYVASSLNPYGYIWAGEGQGTHKLIGGNGINLKGCRNMTLIGVRVNNQNANGILIEDGQNIFVSACQFNGNNMTQGPFQDMKSNIASTYIIGTLYNGQYVDSNVKPIQFSTSTNNADWDHIPMYLSGFGQGIFTVTDYYGAAHRPSGAGTYLEGTIEVVDDLVGSAGPTVGRTYIRLSDNSGNQYYRYCVINYSTGAYSNDSGWIQTHSV